MNEWCEHYRYDEKCASEWLRENFTNGITRISVANCTFKFSECPYCDKRRPEPEKTLAEKLRERHVFHSEDQPYGWKWDDVANTAKTEVIKAYYEWMKQGRKDNRSFESVVRAL